MNEIKTISAIMPHSDRVGIACISLTSALYVYSMLVALVPAGVVTSTWATPAACAPVVQEMTLSEITVNEVQVTPPIVTPMAPVKPVPLIVTGWPPVVGPVVGLIAVIVGAEGDGVAPS